MKIKEIVARYTKGDKITKGSVVKLRSEGKKLILKTTGAESNKGKLELGKEKEGSFVPLLTVENALDFQDYEIPETGVLEALDIDSKDVDKLDAKVEATLDTKQPLDFAKVDYDTVHREIIDIKSCRTNIFVGTMGILGAISVAILGILGVKEQAFWLSWLPFAALVPVCLLLTAIFATIHKARGINVRAGYMEALAEDLANDNPPTNSFGWAKAKFIMDRCVIPKGETQTDKTKCPKRPTKTRCHIVARELARRNIKNVRWRAPFLHSFTSLSTYIYGIALLAAIGALLVAIVTTIKAKTELNLVIYSLSIVAGAVITAIFSGIIVLRRLSEAKAGLDVDEAINLEVSGKDTPFEKFVRYYGYGACVLAHIVFVVLISALTKDKLASWVPVATYFLGGLMSATAIWGVYACYTKVNQLRRGRYSIERWRHVWKIRFERCPLMVEKTQTVLATNPDNSVQTD